MRRITGDNRSTDRGQERGAILPMAAAGIIVAVIAASLSVDLGAMAVKRKDLQKLADLSAMDASYVIDELAADPLAWPLALPQLASSDQQATDAAAESLDRNGFDALGATVFEVDLGEYVRDAPTEFQPCADILSTLPLCTPNAVRVVLGDEVPKYFDMSTSTRSTQVEAIATLTPGNVSQGLSNLSVGSFAARLDANPNPLVDHVLSKVLEDSTGVPDGSLSADLVSYRGLAATWFTLGDLAGVLTGGDVNALLNAELSYKDLVDATLTVLENGGAAAEARAALATISHEVEGVGPLSLSLGGAGFAAGESSWINTLDLVVGSAMIASGDHFFELSLSSADGDLPPELSSISQVDVAATVIEAPTPQWVEDGGSVSNSQIRMEVTVTLLDEYTVLQGSELVGGIAGTVTDAVTGEPIPGATITLDLIGPNPAVTDGAGAYSFVNVSVGPHTLTFSAPGYESATAPVVVESGQVVTQDAGLVGNPTPETAEAIVGDGGAGGLTEPVASSQVKIPFLIELVNATASPTAMCDPARALVDITTSAAKVTVGDDEDFLAGPEAPEPPALGPFPEELAPVDVLVSELLSAVAGVDPFAHVPPTPTLTENDVEMFPGDVHTAQIVPTAPTADNPAGDQLAELLEARLDLSGILGDLTPAEALAAENLLNEMLDELVAGGADGYAEILVLFDLLSSGFGVGLLGADVTLHDVVCAPGPTVSGSIPMLVE